MAKKSAVTSFEGAKKQAQKMGMSSEQIQELLKLFGESAPMLFTMFMRLVDIFKKTPPVVAGADFGDHCPAHLLDTLAEAEDNALHALAGIMCARHCCECHDDEE